MSLATLANAVLFACTGLAVFLLALAFTLKALPGRLWSRAVSEDSVSAALVVSALALSLAWIVSAAVH